jgi:hypothetical protein
VCGALDDNVSSATWIGLPVPADAINGSSSMIMFYRGIDCTGPSKGWPTSYESTPSLKDVGLDDLASSVMFLDNDTEVRNGIQNICSYKMTTVA